MPKFKLEMQAEIYRKDGTLRKQYPWKPINSLLKNFILTLACQLAQAGQTMTDTTGNVRANIAAIRNFDANAAAATTTYGLVIGTGENAVTLADTKLQTQVVTNIGHGIHSFLVENPDAATCRIAVTRVFTNSTGATLSIAEVGLYVIGTANLWKFCIDRALYSVSVPNGENLSLTYRNTITL